MNTVTDHRQDPAPLRALLALLNGGHEVTFVPPDYTLPDFELGRYECVVTDPAGDVITARGATPAAALAAASPLSPPEPASTAVEVLASRLLAVEAIYEAGHRDVLDGLEARIGRLESRVAAESFKGGAELAADRTAARAALTDYQRAADGLDMLGLAVWAGRLAGLLGPVLDELDRIDRGAR